MILPERFKERMISLIGEGEAQELFWSIEDEDAVRAFRVNRIKTDIDSFERYCPSIDRRRAEFPPDAYITREEYPGGLACHHSGAIYMQDISAMSTVAALGESLAETGAEGVRVLDCCSAPGGKTTQLAAAVGVGGVVVANEYDKKRCRILQNNVERLGACNVVICNLDTAVLSEVYPEFFDLVLCDAPCSGEGMFRKNSRAVEEWSEENVKMCAERQREILLNVAKCVSIGGRLLYSTCTFSLEENEENVAWFLSTHKDFRLIDVSRELREHTSDGIALDGCEADLTKCRRIYPHRSMGEGQFIALLERCGCDGEARIENGKKRKGAQRGERKGERREDRATAEAQGAARKFLGENLVGELWGESCRELMMLGGYIYLAPRIHLPEYNVVSAGVCVGEYQKGRILPHHQLFSACGRDFGLKICLSGDDDDAKRYLRGEEISVEGKIESADGRESGWAAVLIDGCAVGGAKISGQVAKNHYPKGLRNK